MQDFLKYNYKFLFPDGDSKDYTVKLSRNNLSLILDEKDSLPDWTKMENFRCRHCPLDSTAAHCPLALSLVDVLMLFNNNPSYENIELTVETDTKNYHKTTSLQSGLSGLIGILMVTSGCPVMGKLKPLVKFHQPYQTLEEAEYRVLSMYLLAQYLAWKKGGTPDWEMENLSKIYEDIGEVNVNVCRKIADLEAKDSSINSIVALNNFAEYVSFNLDEKRLEEMEKLFHDYFE